MQKLRDAINKISFKYDREEKALQAIEEIFRLVASRDLGNLQSMEETKLGSAFLDIAEVYGSTTHGSMAKWHIRRNENGTVTRYTK